eukprot:TRINITY_DN10036_c0_g3_i1.p1 TRINITY_DN10036_c0_g3~~TRINITY_DN10036_c0_g3_i1.p1  ORF type:complete len:546 (+),score=134.62 TRINITY_DN10036_c0_g3_i1:39-1676(+)
MNPVRQLPSGGRARMGQHCCCLGGTVEADEREEAPRASSREKRVRGFTVEEASCRGGVAAEEAAARSALAQLCLRGRESAECAAAEQGARGALEAAAEEAALCQRERWGRGELQIGETRAWEQRALALLRTAEGSERGRLQSAQDAAWGAVYEEAIKARCAADACPAGSLLCRSNSCGRDSDGSGPFAATPEASSLGDPTLPAEAAAARRAPSYEELVDIREVLGQGTFGIVFAGEVRDAAEGSEIAMMPKQVAVKVFATPDGDADRMQWALDTVTRLPHHSNLVTTYIHGQLPQHVGENFFAQHSRAKESPVTGMRLHYRWAVMSMAPKTVKYIIHSMRSKGRRLPMKILAPWMQQAACGMAELHQHGLVHTDFKAENLLLAASPEAGVFTCQVCDTDSVHQVGVWCKAATASYLDPLLYAKKVRITSFDWDVWSLGITAHVVFTQGVMPSGMAEAFEAGERGEYAQIRARQGLSAVVGSLLEDCWRPAGQRCTASDFATRCNPRALHKAIPKGSPDYEAVMHIQDRSLEEWLEPRLKAKATST